MHRNSTPRRALPRNGFDKLSRVYRWMEYLSFGPLLWQVRAAFLPSLQQARSALVLGDGDGRFAAALLRANGTVRVYAVDASGAMLQRLRERVAGQGDSSRVEVLCADATQELPHGHFDLVCTHFFLDCLTDEQSMSLASNVAGRMEADAYWILSEFAIPQGSCSWLTRLLVRSLYAAFALLTGLRVSRLPDHAAALHAAGLERVAVQTRLRGMLRAEMWTLRGRQAILRRDHRIQSGMSDSLDPNNVPGSMDDGVTGASYPPSSDDEIMPSIPGDPVPNPEPEQPSLGVPDPGIFEGTGGTASLDSEW